MNCGITYINWRAPLETDLGPRRPETIIRHSTLNNDYKIGDTVNIMSGTITKHAAQITISENTMGIILNKADLEVGDVIYEVYEVLTGDEKSIVFEEFLKHAIT